MTEIKNGWSHTFVGMCPGLIEMVPVDWLERLANPAPSMTTDLGGDRAEQVDLDGLWRNIEEQGMRDPVMVHLNPRSELARLECGSHRVRMARARGVERLPAVVLLTAKDIVHPTNGGHLFPARHLLREDFLPPPHLPCLLSPSSVFR